MVRFDSILASRSLFPAGESPAPPLQPGPCAMGPSTGETPVAMHVWIFQQQDDGVALAAGAKRENPIFTSEGEPDHPRWRVRTVLDPASKPFELGKPAVGVAIAVLSEGNTADIREWSQAVIIEQDSPNRGNSDD